METESPIIAPINGIIGLTEFFIHSFILIFLLSIRQLRGQKSNQLIININIGHAVTGVTLFITWFSLTSIVTHVTFVGVTLGNVALVMLTVDRCIMIRWPFRYQTLPKLFHFTLMTFPPLTVIGTFIQGILTKRNIRADKDPEAMKYFVFGMSFLILVLLISNSIVYWTLIKQKRAIKSCQVSQPSETSSRDKGIRILKEARSFYICIGCVLTYIVLWFPAIVIQALWVLNGDNTAKTNYQGVSTIIHNLNPLFDALILVWFNKDLKMHLKRLFFRRKVRFEEQQCNTGLSSDNTGSRNTGNV